MREGDAQRRMATNDSIVDAKRLATKRGIGYLNLVGSRSKPCISIQECLRSEVLALSVERHRGATIDLDCIRTTVWADHSIYLHVRT